MSLEVSLGLKVSGHRRPVVERRVNPFQVRGWAPVRQKLGMILENKVVQKLKLEKNVFPKKWPIFFDFFFEKNPLILT